MDSEINKMRQLKNYNCNASYSARDQLMVLSGVCLFEGGGLKKGTPAISPGVPELGFRTSGTLRDISGNCPYPARLAVPYVGKPVAILRSLRPGRDCSSGDGRS